MQRERLTRSIAVRRRKLKRSWSSAGDVPGLARPRWRGTSVRRCEAVAEVVLDLDLAVLELVDLEDVGARGVLEVGEAEGGEGQDVEADEEALVVAEVHGAGDGGGPDLGGERGG